MATMWQRLTATLRVWEPSPWRAPPSVDAQVGVWVPGWVLRVLVVVTAAAASALVADNTFQWTVLLLSVVFMVGVPDGGGALGFPLAVGVLLAAGEPGGDIGAALLLVVLVHLTLVLHALTPGVASRARVELAILRAPLVRFLAIQGVALPLLLLGSVVSSSGHVIAWLPVVAAVVLALLAWWLRTRIVTDPR